MLQEWRRCPRSTEFAKLLARRSNTVFSLVWMAQIMPELRMTPAMSILPGLVSKSDHYDSARKHSQI